MKNYKKREKGITLIALVITIIVLLILAGIAIAALSGENGILIRANEAKKEYSINQAKEKIQLAIAEYQTKMREETLYNILRKIIGVEEITPDDESGPEYIVVVDGYEFIIEEDFNIEYTGKKDAIAPSIISIEEKKDATGEKTVIEIKAKTEDEEGIKEIRILRNKKHIETISNIKGKEVTQEYEVTANGEYTVIVIGVNERRVSQTIAMTVMQYAPQITVVSGNKLENDWYTDDVKIKIETVVEEEEEKSKITTKYKITGQNEEIAENGEKEVIINTDGIFEVVAYSVTENGLQSEETKITIKRDTTAPANFNPVQQKTNFAQKQITIEAKTTDISQIKEYRYYLEGEFIGSTSNETYTITVEQEDKEYELYVIAVDNVGKETKSGTIKCMLRTYIYRSNTSDSYKTSTWKSEVVQNNSCGRGWNTYGPLWIWAESVYGVGYGEVYWKTRQPIDVTSFARICFDMKYSIYLGQDKWRTWLQVGIYRESDDTGKFWSLEGVDRSGDGVISVDIRNYTGNYTPEIGVFSASAGVRTSMEVRSIWFE